MPAYGWVWREASDIRVGDILRGVGDEELAVTEARPAYDVTGRPCVDLALETGEETLVYLPVAVWREIRPGMGACYIDEDGTRHPATVRGPLRSAGYLRATLDTPVGWLCVPSDDGRRLSFTRHNGTYYETRGRRGRLEIGVRYLSRGTEE